MQQPAVILVDALWPAGRAGGVGDVGDVAGDAAASLSFSESMSITGSAPANIADAVSAADPAETTVAASEC